MKSVIVPLPYFLGVNVLQHVRINLSVQVFLQVRIAVCGFGATGAQAIYILIHARAGAG
jgi:hypothetical protein